MKYNELSNTYKVYTIKFIDIEIKDYTYQFFSENREKFISYLNYEEIINKIKI
jgi:hypothetical protein